MSKTIDGEKGGFNREQPNTFYAAPIDEHGYPKWRNIAIEDVKPIANEIGSNFTVPYTTTLSNITKNAADINVLTTDFLTLADKVEENIDLNLEGFASLQNTVNNHTTSLGSLTDIVTNHTESIGTLNTNVGNNTSSIGTLNTTTSGHTTSITELNSITEEHAEDIEENTTSINTNTASINTLNSTTSGHTTNLNTLNGTTSTNTTNISNNTTSINNLNTTVGEHTTSINTLNSTTSSNTSNIATNTASINTANSNITTNTNSITNLNSIVSGHTTNIVSLNDTTTTNTTNISNNTASIGTLNTTVGNHTTSIGTNTSSIATLNTGLGTTNDNLTSLTTQVNTVSGTGSYLKQTSATLISPTIQTPTFSAALSVANGGTGVTTSTGTGNNVLSASPALTGTTTINGGSGYALDMTVARNDNALIIKNTNSGGWASIRYSNNNTSNDLYIGLGGSTTTNEANQAYIRTTGANGLQIFGTLKLNVTLATIYGGTGTTTATGTGSNVLSASPTFTGTVNAAALALTTALPVASGGTGVASTSQNFAFLGPLSGSGAPTWRAITSADIPPPGTPTFADLTPNGVMYASSSSLLASTATGTQYQSLIANATGAPSFQAVNLAQANAVTGTLPASLGGTGVTTSTGTGSNVLSDSPTFTGSISVGSATLTTPLALTSGGTGTTTATGTGSVVLNTSPTFTGTITADALTLSTVLPVTSGGTGTSTSTGTGSTVRSIAPALTGTTTINGGAGYALDISVARNDNALIIKNTNSGGWASIRYSNNNTSNDLFIGLGGSTTTNEANQAYIRTTGANGLQIFGTLKLNVTLATIYGGTGTTTSTGTGSNVLSASPTFTGTVNAAALALTTALPVASGGTGTTTSTGTGSTVLSASPTFTGTVNAAALALTTSLPVASGGTGVSNTSQNFAFLGPLDGIGPPTWRAITSADIPPPGTPTFADLTPNGVMYASSSSLLASTATGTQYQSLIANATGAPSFQAVNLAQATAVTGTLPVLSGGTGVTTSTGTGSNVLSVSPTFTGTVTASKINLNTTANAPLTITNSNSAAFANQLFTNNTGLILAVGQGGSTLGAPYTNQSYILPSANGLLINGLLKLGNTLDVIYGGTGVTTSTGTGSNVLSISPTLTGTTTINSGGSAPLIINTSYPQDSINVKTTTTGNQASIRLENDAGNTAIMYMASSGQVNANNQPGIVVSDVSKGFKFNTKIIQTVGLHTTYHNPQVEANFVGGYKHMSGGTKSDYLSMSPIIVAGTYRAPITGIYQASLTFSGGSTNDIEFFITKNVFGYNNLNVGDDRLLATSHCRQDTISVMVHLTKYEDGGSSDWLTFGLFSRDTTLFPYGNNTRNTITMTLLQRTA